MRFIVLVILCVCGNVITEASNVSWSKIITDDGKHIGYASRTSKMVDGARISSNYTYLRIRENDSPTKNYIINTEFFRNSNDEIIRIERSSGFHNNKITLLFEVIDSQGVITRKSNAGEVTKTFKLLDDLALDNGASLLRTWDFKVNSVLEFNSLNLLASVIEKNIIELAPTQNPDPKVLSLVRKTYAGDALRKISQFNIDESNGNILTSELDLLNRKILHVPASEDESKKGVKALSVVQSSMIPSLYKLSKAALKGNIRYRFSFLDNVDFNLPQSGEQKTVRADNYIVLDICENCGVTEKLEKDDLEQYLMPSTWIESDDYKIKAKAKNVLKSDLDAYDKMEKLGRIARRRINSVDFMGHYSAADAFRRRSGDCGEDALLLAALGRAAGIPTRVASGLVYSRSDYHGQSNVFMPHIWTQAYIEERWVSFDISLGGFDASHILTSVGQGDPSSIGASIQLAKRLQWEDMLYMKTD